MTRSATGEPVSALTAQAADIARRRIDVNGIVQGVGFRPFVYRLAIEHQLAGFVMNTGQGVVIEVQGAVARLAEFDRALRQQAPPAASITELIVTALPLQQEAVFVITPSHDSGAVITGLPPDLAICDDCWRELLDPANRRFGYPFINCTRCGPRYTITGAIPYDRPNTSMCGFVMCSRCQAEYDDPLNRRFHAQPNACPECGPRLWLADSGGQWLAEREAAVSAARRLLQQGRVVAIKGIGGFHLAVDAANETAVRTLRQRKGREEKPLAVMVRDPGWARQICRMSAAEVELLRSPARPIVLARQQDGHGLAPSIAPGGERFGLMLPYAPLHHLLLDESLPVLVMTSGNRSEEPIAIGNQEARARLAGIADFFLCHDRDILIRADDSVAWHISGTTRMLRRSRGYAPRPLRLAHKGPSVLGVGGELKSTVCYIKGNQAYLSQHIGDLKNLEAYGFFRETVAHLGRVYQVDPELVAHDLHPAYLSSQWARESAGRPLLAVQHHHAHLAACLAENHHSGPAIGIILDGTGYGTDGTIWGGEVLIGDLHGFRRFARFEPMPLPGGDAAVAEPWRTGVAYLQRAFGGSLPALPFLADHDAATIVAMVGRKLNCPFTTSCGRLFDAVAAISGGRPVIRYEAQAAVEFMQAAGGTLAGPAFPFELIGEHDMVSVALSPIIRGVAEAVLHGATPATVSQRFHFTLVEIFAELVKRASRATGLKDVALSGGVFQNQLLFAGLHQRLADQGFMVLAHRELPANDGCIAFGQAVVGRAYLSR